MEVCRITYRDNVFAFRRDNKGEGNWVCVERKNPSMSVNTNEILYMSLQNELNRHALTNGVDREKLIRFLTKEKKPKSNHQISSIRHKMMGKVVKIFK